MTVLIATGVEREAAILRSLPGVTVIAGGGDARKLEQRLAAHVAGASAIASIGFGGALVPTLAIGDWVVADRVTGSTEATCDPRWADRIVAALPGVCRGSIYADGRLIADLGEKRALGGSATAVDMESHVAAAIAARHDLPFIALRCISDTAAHALPPAVAVAMRPGGGLAVGAVLASILRHPGQLPSLIVTMAAFARAFATFRTAIAAAALSTAISQAIPRVHD